MYRYGLNQYGLNRCGKVLDTLLNKRNFDPLKQARQLIGVSMVTLVTASFLSACNSAPAPTPTITAYLSSTTVMTTLTAASQPGSTNGPAVPDGNVRSADALKVPAQSALPAGQDVARWNAATGSIALASTGNTLTITITAQGLVPNGLYSAWWLNAADIANAGFEPVTTPPAEEFTADAQGRGTLRFNVPSNSNYYSRTIALIYHADNKSYGVQPVDLSQTLNKTAFIHLLGSGPGLALPENMSTQSAAPASVNESTGVVATMPATPALSETQPAATVSAP